jgi:transposase
VLIVETKAKIRRLHGREQKPLREIARELKLARNTVRRAVREELLGAPRYVRHTQPCPKLGEFVARLADWLEQDSRLPRRQRRTARGLYEDLCREGYRGAYDSVQRYVKRWKGQKTAPSQVFIPLAFAPGEAYQFDFSEEEVEIAGAVLRVKVAQFKLCYSGMPFAVAYPCERLEMVLDAHNRAFAFFGGSPTRGIYDNLKTCVTEVLPGKERRFNPRFLALMGHYLVEPVACTPAAGWEKGQVENLVGNLREWLFVPRPRFDSFQVLNAWLQAAARSNWPSGDCIHASRDARCGRFFRRSGWRCAPSVCHSMATSSTSVAPTQLPW